MIRKYQGAGKPNRFWNFLTNATLRSAINENPSIATSTGYEVNPDTGAVTQDPAALDKTARPELANLRNNLAVMSGTAYAAPAAPALVNAAVSNPITTGKFLTSMLGGMAVDEGVRTYTGFDGWGDLLYNKSGTRHLVEKLPEDMQQKVAPASKFLWGFANPGFYTEGITNQLYRGAKQVVPAAKQLVKEAEAVNYAGMKADANAARKALTSGKTRIKVGDVEINNPNLNYRQVGSGTAKDFIETGNQFGKIKISATDTPLTLRLKRPLDNPMYKKGSLWYGINNAEKGIYPDLLVTAEPMDYATKYGHLASVDRGGRRIPSGTLNSENTGAYVFEPGYGYRKVQTDPKISVSLPYDRVAPTDGRINTARNYYAGDDFNNYVQLINDTEPGYYSVHFKTDKGSPTSNAVQKVVDKIVSDLPGGSKVATWGSVTKGGFSGLDRFRKAGMIKTGEFRPLAFKDPSVANEVAQQYRLTLNADGTINWPIRRKLYDPQPLSKAELAGLPKVERNQPYKPTTWLQGDDAVNMFRTYGVKEPVVENSPLMEQIRKYVPEARERYGLWGNTNITDDEIAGALYKRAFQLSGENNGAVNAYGEPIILFRGDTQRYPHFKTHNQDGGSPDNRLGTLFLGEYPMDEDGLQRYLGRYYSSASEIGKGGNTKVMNPETSKATSPLEGRTDLDNEVGQMVPLSSGIYKLKGSDMSSGVNDINAFIVRSPSVRDATTEIPVINEELFVEGKIPDSKLYNTRFYYDNGQWHDSKGDIGSNWKAAIREHFDNLLNKVEKSNQGLLVSHPTYMKRWEKWAKKDAVLPSFRDEHSDYNYYVLPDFNRHNAKHLLGYDLNYPLENSWMLYRKNGGKI